MAECRPAATALIRPLAWEPSCAAGAALGGQRTKKKEKKRKKEKEKKEKKKGHGATIILILFVGV